MTRRLSPNRKSGRRGFTLAELIMAVALLAFFSVFIVQMFAKADQLAKKARSLDQAVNCAANLADLWKMDSTDGIPVTVLDLRQNRAAGRTATISLDSHFQISSDSQPVYLAAMTLQPAPTGSGNTAQPGLWQLTVIIGRPGPSNSGPIYTLQTTRYFPEEATRP